MRLHPRMHYAAQAGCLGLFLAIGSAWIGPKFTRASYQSKDAVLCEALRYLRAEIQVYQTEHSNSTPGYAARDESALAWTSDDLPDAAPPDSETFVRQLTQFTDAAGHVKPSRCAPCDLGPYLIGIPQNPFTLKSGVWVVDQDQMPPLDQSKPYGWIYNARTGQLIANLTGIDSYGVAYANY